MSLQVTGIIAETKIEEAIREVRADIDHAILMENGQELVGLRILELQLRRTLVDVRSTRKEFQG